MKELITSVVLLISLFGLIGGVGAGDTAIIAESIESDPIDSSNNLLASQDAQASTILAAAPATTATDAAASSSLTDTQNAQYDAVYSFCGYVHSTGQATVNNSSDNAVGPMTPIYSYMFEQGMSFELIKSTPVQVNVLKIPAHGDLTASGDKAFFYRANPGYLGSDQIVFEVDVLGLKFKVIETVIVHNSGSHDYPTDAAIETLHSVCPEYNSSSLNIIELPTDGFASDEELAKLHSLISFAIGSVGTDNSTLFTFADLPGGAVGQTVGNTITLALTLPATAGSSTPALV